LQIPGGEGQAIAMVVMACIVALGAVVLSEALARRVAAKISGA
jgi:molybdate transport system permease protein